MTNERNIVNPLPRINLSFGVLKFDNNKGGLLTNTKKRECSYDTRSLALQDTITTLFFYFPNIKYLSR